MMNTMMNDLRVLEVKSDLIAEVLFLLQNKDPNYARAVFHEKVVLEIKELLAIAENLEAKL